VTVLRVHRCDGKEWRTTEGAAGLERARDGSPCWIEAVEPDAAERALLGEKLGLHEMALAEALEKEHPPVFREFDDHVFVIVHAPASSEQRSTRKIALFLIAPLVTKKGPAHAPAPVDPAPDREE
jgi:magnesium transporter